MRALALTLITLIVCCRPPAAVNHPEGMCRTDRDCFSEERCHLDPKGGNFCLVDFTKARSR